MEIIYEIIYQPYDLEEEKDMIIFISFYIILYHFCVDHGPDPGVLTAAPSLHGPGSMASGVCMT